MTREFSREEKGAKERKKEKHKSSPDENYR